MNNKQGIYDHLLYRNESNAFHARMITIQIYQEFDLYFSVKNRKNILGMLYIYYILLCILMYEKYKILYQFLNRLFKIEFNFVSRFPVSFVQGIFSSFKIW